MNKVKILWSGITGRTGKEAVEVAKGDDTVEIVAGEYKLHKKVYILYSPKLFKHIKLDTKYITIKNIVINNSYFSKLFFILSPHLL